MQYVDDPWRLFIVYLRFNGIIYNIITYCTVDPLRLFIVCLIYNGIIYRMYCNVDPLSPFIGINSSLTYYNLYLFLCRSITPFVIDSLYPWLDQILFKPTTYYAD